MILKKWWERERDFICCWLFINIFYSHCILIFQVKVILRIVSTNHHGDHAASFLNIDTRNKQVTVYDPAASGYATSMAHRKAAMAPKMFAFDGVYSPDDGLVRIFRCLNFFSGALCLFLTICWMLGSIMINKVFC